MPGRSRFAAALLLAGILTGCRNPYVVTRNLSYGPALGIYGQFDLYEPLPDSAPKGTARPAIIAIHGGAWRGGDKAWGQQIAEEFCPAGYVVLSINYRLSSRANGRWPAQIEDVQKALRYIRSNAATLGIDAERVATLGMSAGGHLAVMAALRDDAVDPAARARVAVNLDGEHDMTMPPESVMADFDAIMTAVMGHPAPWSQSELRDISTVTFARPDVSVLTVHGAGDRNVYVAQGERLHAVLRSAGADSELIRVGGAAGKCHEDCWREPAAREALHRFLDRTLSRGERR